MNPFFSSRNRGAGAWMAFGLSALLMGCSGNGSNGGPGTVNLPSGSATPIFFVTAKEGEPALIESVATDSTHRRFVSQLGAGTNQVTISPDHTKVVYVQANGLTIQDVDGRHRRRLTRNPLGTFDGTPAFRPDGKAVLFTRLTSERPRRNLHLAVVDVATGQVASIGDGNVPGLNAEYSPDGSQIIFATTDSGSFDNPAYAGEELYRIGADGSNPLRLTRTPDREIEATFNPDGKRIAFITSRFVQRDIYTADIDGSSVRRVLKDNDNASTFFDADSLVFVNENLLAFATHTDSVQLSTVRANISDGTASPVLTDSDVSVDALVH